MKADRATLFGIALVCWANLLLEVLITRLFSATMFYHFTFMAVGLAMFGVAASGVFVFLRGDKVLRDVARKLREYSQWFAISTLCALLFITEFPIFKNGQLPEMDALMIVHLLALVILTALPFFFAGLVVSLSITWFRDDVNRVYAFDLAGAAAAAMVCGLVLAFFGAPTAVLVAATGGLLAGVLFDRTSRTRWVAAGGGVVLVVLNVLHPFVRVGSVKWEGDLKFEKWNVFSRITVDGGYLIKIDAGAATLIHSLRELAPGIEKDKITALALGTWDSPPDNVLIIGPGGGRDVLFALAGGAKRITAVEINPLIANNVMRGRYAKYSAHLYTDPRVNLVVDEGRSFVRRSTERYDMIQASLVDTWAATAAGAFALTENTLYTTEAFEDYFAHLTDRGVVTMTRFYTSSDGEGASESPRLLLLASGTLERLGVKPADVRKHIFFATSPDEPQGTLVAKRTEFTPDEVKRLEERAAFAHMTILVAPNTPGTSQLERYLDAGAWSDLVAGAKDELTPPTDDRPFFFFFKKFGDLLHVSGQIYDPGLWVLISLGSVLGLGLFFTLLPLLVRLVRTGTQSPREPAGTQTIVLVYFGLVGFAFMAVEIALMQRFTLFVGHPSYSLLVVLFSILLSTSVGAALTARFPQARLGRVMVVAGIGLGVLAAIYGFVLGDLLRTWIGLDRPVRIAITTLLVAPCGLLMGAMIPSAVRVLGAAESSLVPWGWGVNGAMSVIGTSIATLVAIYGGFTATFLVGGAIYITAGALGLTLDRRYRMITVRTKTKTVQEIIQ